jgi:cytochrome bd-type quinol oxidase subunit 1
MDLPVIPTPIFPRWVWIEEITYSHIPIATMITAFMVLAPAFEYVGYKLKDERYDRLARGLIWFAMILFSPGAALGTGIPMWIMGAYPEFWSRWTNLFFWPLIGQFAFFMGEVIFLFFFYYLMWDLLRDRKRLHIFFGVAAAFFGLMVQFVWDAVGSYMLTPSVPLPGIETAVGWSAKAFFNPSFPYLFTHRFFGNISYVMMLVGGYFALKAGRKKEEPEKEYFTWAADFMFTIGVIAFFAMPAIGWGYAKVIQAHSPVAFTAIMSGHTSSKFIVKMAMVFVLAVSGITYLFVRYQSRLLQWGLTAGVVSVASLFWIHPPLFIWGGTTGWRVLHTFFPVAFMAFCWLVARNWDHTARAWRRVMFAAGVAAFVAFLIGGFVKSNARQPYTVYKEILKPESKPYEEGRFLFNERCVICHAGAWEFEQWRGRNWESLVQSERDRAGADLSDDETRLIIDYLKEKYP